MAAATACANIALVKYWGKRSSALNLPAAGSLSLTLEALSTHTEVELHDGDEDELVIDGRRMEGRPLERVRAFVDLVRLPAADRRRVRITSANAFPTGAGLASSASAFAALAVAVSEAFGAGRSSRALSVLARRGSGSAARSIFGGFVEMVAGEGDDSSSSYARPVLDARIELAAAIAVTGSGPKAIGSTEGMEHTRRTSPYHEVWIAQAARDLELALRALRASDLDALAEVSEGSCLAMHADAMAARPGVVYFQGATLRAIETVRRLRRSGVPVFFTVDAGPHVVAFTPPEHLEKVAAALEAEEGVARVIRSRAGEGARLVESWVGREGPP